MDQIHRVSGLGVEIIEKGCEFGVGEEFSSIALILAVSSALRLATVGVMAYLLAVRG